MDKPLWGLRVQAPVARSGPGSGLRRCFPVFPKVDAASPRGLMAPPGLSALGAKGSVRDRLTPPGRVEGFRPRELYSIAALAKYGAFGAIIYMPIPPAAGETIKLRDAIF